ncbi:similar to Saccharomyces cerevisiae YHR146W CRP1 Protein that binds to cruciform DNA structures [Maudiozyma barnettii]|nr:similar to Saccharomyces cerevisiae YHR146W CRP1 Protein that binds to cruciform DNA structures [Kazachstania barnettii]
MSVTTKNYEFTWPAGPKDVVLTGVFDEWKGSMPLVRQADGSFALTFPIQKTEGDNKFVFKFIVDGDWTVSDSYKKEADAGGIENNYVDLTSVDATGTSENVAKIPEAGGLPVGSADASGSATPNPTPKPARAPPSTSNRKKGKKGKKMKVKKRIRRNKKTGERTVMSQEVEEMETSATNTPNEEVTEEATEEDTEDGANDEETSESATPAPAPAPAEPAATAPVATEAEQEMHTLPVDQNKATTQFEDTTAIAQTGPGPVLTSNPEEIKEFKEVSEVDADELNARLNKELKEEEANEKKVAEEEEPVEPKPEEEEPVEPKTEEAQPTQTLDPKINTPTEEPSVAEESAPIAAAAPVVAEEKKPQTTSQPKEKKKSSSKSKTTKDTKKTTSAATKTAEQPPKKKGIFGKLKSLFK